ncbi:hypothetical protein ABEZ07_17675, partial [Bordetella pertussis]
RHRARCTHLQTQPGRIQPIDSSQLGIGAVFPRAQRERQCRSARVRCLCTISTEMPRLLAISSCDMPSTCRIRKA